MLNLTTGYLLVSHGSRDPRPQEAMANLAARLAEVLASPVGWATLEFGQESLALQIQHFARTQPVDRIYIVPLFLSSGVHVCDDIPEQIAIAHTGLASENSPPEVRLTPFGRPDASLGLITLPHLGNAIDFASSAWERMQHHSEVEAWILVAHGSRRLGGNAEIEAISNRLQAKGANHCLAYWSIEGQLVARIEELLASGCRAIGFVPHFLFPGRLTDAIEAVIHGGQAQAPEVAFHGLETWSESPEWFHSLRDWLIRETQPQLATPDSSRPTPSIASRS